jgi:hypothetical protein
MRAALCYGTVRTGSCWWYFRAWQAYVFSLIWFAAPAIFAAAWLGAGPWSIASFLLAGLLVHLCLFATLRWQARRNVVT